LWERTDAGLASIGHGAVLWRPGVNHAYCWGRMHWAPDPGCECGLAAYHWPPKNEGSHIIGAVLAWGRTEVHYSGFRSECAQVLALYQEFPGQAKMMNRLSELYQVPVRKSIEGLVAYSKEYADPVPRHLRPPKPKETRTRRWFGSKWK
jgi:hypothetical protein